MRVLRHVSLQLKNGELTLRKETMPENKTDATAVVGAVPHPGSQVMPRWNVGELPEPPKFTWRKWFTLLGPGLLLGGAAIGGGEWLIGPIVTAKFGGALLWLATVSIIAQAIYNIEVSRYALYTGEPIFTGKFRTLPGPMFWVFVYLLLDFGGVFPYLASNAAIPLASIYLGSVPNPEEHKGLLRGIAVAIFLVAMLPLLFGGKIYIALKALMTFKIFVVMGFLLIVAVLYSKPQTWVEIFSGFAKIGNVPIKRGEDLNKNGRLDKGEDWDGDGLLDVVEPSMALVFDTDNDAKNDASDIDLDGKPDNMVKIMDGDKTTFWPDLDGDGKSDESIKVDTTGDGTPDTDVPLDRDGDGKLDSFLDVDGQGTRDGDNVDNIFFALLSGRTLPSVDFGMVAFLSALVAIAGSGGLSNTVVSNYTRDQGWGMGAHVGAIPSIVGGREIKLSHVGTVFLVNQQVMPRWKRWYRHVMRDQLAVWAPACFIGLALPSMLSVEFLPRGFEVENNWTPAAMTAEAVRDRAVEEGAGPMLGYAFWFMTLFCGFLVLGPSMATAADGFLRRWVDTFWTASKFLRSLDTAYIRYVYFLVLTVFMTLGLALLSLEKPLTLVLIATTIYNYALGFSCWHTLAVNLVILPRELRPGWFIRIAMTLSGFFYTAVAVVATVSTLKMLSE